MSLLMTYPLRMPLSMRAGLERLSKADGVSINQFVNVAIAEKMAMLQAEDYFTQRRMHADMSAFDALMSRSGGEPPRKGDEAE